MVELSKSLLELIEGDLQGHCSYVNHEKRNEFIEDACDVRMFENDAEKCRLSAVTAHLNLRIIENMDYEVDYQRDIYNELIILGLIQKVSVMNFQREVSKIYSMNHLGELNSHWVLRIVELQERYVAFQNQYLYKDVTPYREGTRVYNRIREVLMVDQEDQEITDKLNRIYELADMNQSYELNKGGTVLSVIAMICTFFSLITLMDDIGKLSITSYIGYKPFIVWFLISFASLLYTMKIVFRKKK